MAYIDDERLHSRQIVEFERAHRKLRAVFGPGVAAVIRDLNMVISLPREASDVSQPTAAITPATKAVC